MGQQTLRTVITIGGSVDNTFGQIGEALIGLGSQIDIISQKLIDLGKESVQEYVDYDDLMRETKAVGEFTDAEMEMLDEINREIAKTTIYSNKQAAQADVIMGQYGLSIQEIAELLPSVLDLAMVGHLEMADSVDYLYSSLMSLGEGMDYADELTDMMAKTAAIGATDIDTLGESMTRLGSGLSLFGGGAPEVLTILTAMSQFGEDMRGTQGGTALRNFALSLVAPSGQGDLVSAMLESYGLSEDDFDSYLADEEIDLTNAAKTLEGLGLQVFDEQGNMRDMLDIIFDLKQITAGMNDKTLDATLRQIFGRRGYVLAKNLLSVSEDEYLLDYDQIIDSEGFADEMADTMQGGLGGALRELEAAFSLLKTTIGESLAPTVQDVADGMHDIAIYISEMDSDELDAIVSALSVVAVAGPSLLAAGTALRLIGYLFTPAGMVGMGLVGMAAFALYLQQIQDADFSDNFGDMQLDMEALTPYVDSLGQAFEDSYTDIDAFDAALAQAVDGYKTASQTFSSKLTTAMLTGNRLSATDQSALMSLGDDMLKGVIDGIENSTAGSMTFWQMLFGGEGVAENDADYQSLIGVLGDSHDEAMAEAKQIGEDLRAALTDAFADGVISEDEYANILSYVKSYNEAIARAEKEAADEAALVERQKMLYKAETISYDDLDEYSNYVEEQRDALLSQKEDEYLTERFNALNNYDQQIENAETNQEKGKLRKEKGLFLANAESKHALYMDSLSATYDDALQRAWQSALEQSDLSDAFTDVGKYADDYLSNKRSASFVTSSMQDQYSAEELQQLGEYLYRWIDSLGGYTGIKDKMDYYQSIGDTESANELARLIAMQGIASDFRLMSISDESLFGWYNGDVTTSPFQDTLNFDMILDNYMGNYEVTMPDGSEMANTFAADGQSALDANPGSWKVYIKPQQTGVGVNVPQEYAEGGRATVASIFGEDGAEWAIPEEHSERTAALLDAARAASGFSWSELLSMYGGLGAGARTTIGQVVYAPQIYANDATGVAEKLAEDKKRFEKWFEEYQAREETEVYE